jgi:ATP-binding cassette subfamily C protein CydC
VTAPARPRAGRSLRLVPVLREEWPLFVRTTAVSVSYQLVAVLTAATGAGLVGAVVAEAGGGLVGALIVSLAAVVVGNGVLNWTEMWLAHVLAYQILARFRLKVFDGLHRAAPGGLLRRRTGDMAGAAMADVEVLEWFYAHTASATIAAVLAPLILVGLLAAIIGWAALLVLLALAAMAAVPWLLRHVAARQGAEIRAELAVLKSEALDGVQGLRELLIFGQGERHLRRVIEHTRALQRRHRAYALRSGAEKGVAEGIVAVTALGVIALCAGRVSAGELPIGLFPAAVVLTVGAFLPLGAVFGMFQKLGEIGSAAERVFAVTDAPANVTDPEHPATPPARGEPVEVRFDGVTFRYGPDLAKVLHGVSFTVSPGETVALVGESGAGKTTCAHLLMRFWDPTAGAITLNGVPTSSLPQASVRELVGLVSQDGYLFHTSITENVRVALPDAQDARLRSAADGAGLDELAAELPDGLNTVVGERGAALSGGQRQRVAIARALLRDPSVLVLDEPVSNLDAISEAALAETIAAARAGRTTLVIAHRLSTIRLADRVVFLARGRVAATGSHEELLATSPDYRAVIAQHDSLAV